MERPHRMPTTEVRISGVIYPVDWNDCGDVTQVAVRPTGASDVTDDLLVSKEGLGVELECWSREFVTLHGIVLTDESGRRSVYVTEFHLDW